MAHLGGGPTRRRVVTRVVRGYGLFLNACQAEWIARESLRIPGTDVQPDRTERGNRRAIDRVRDDEPTAGSSSAYVAAAAWPPCRKGEGDG